MTERQLQSQFAVAAAQLILQAVEMGYEVTLGDAYRDPRVHGAYGKPGGYGVRSSFHKRRLALDLNLFRNGRMITTTEGHRPLGEWWERGR